MCAMAVFPVTTLLAGLSALLTVISAQEVSPSNDTSDIPPYESSPRFWVNGSDFDHFRIIPLGWYSQISQQNFNTITIHGRLAHINASNANEFTSSVINYISCDPEEYSGGFTANDVLRTVASTQQGNPIILYSTRASHCDASNLRAVANANGVFSTLDPVLAETVYIQLRDNLDGYPGVITPDRQSYVMVNNTPPQTYGPPGNSPGPTTAVAMIILYTITGIITALFVTIIVTGAIRAHRHPERYGPQNVAGRPRRTRAKGIARAMLDTIPIVKFGDNSKDDQQPKKEADVEMAASASASTDATIPDADKNKSPASTSEVNEATAANAITNTVNADGTDEAGHLGCSICTEDFTRGEEVRLLPCNHKFHPECVDPWLLNVSGTCPLCRIDLRPKEEQTQSATEGLNGDERLPHFDSRAYLVRRLSTPAALIPGRDTSALASLRSAVSGSREDRIAALRRFRQQRRSGSRTEGSGDTAEQEEERRGLSTRLRERFRIRTRRQGEEEAEAAGSAASRQRRADSVGPPRATWHT